MITNDDSTDGSSLDAESHNSSEDESSGPNDETRNDMERQSRTETKSPEVSKVVSELPFRGGILMDWLSKCFLKRKNYIESDFHEGIFHCINCIFDHHTKISLSLSLDINTNILIFFFSCCFFSPTITAILLNVKELSKNGVLCTTMAPSKDL